MSTEGGNNGDDGGSEETGWGIPRRRLLALAGGVFAVGAGAWAFRPAPVRPVDGWIEIASLPAGRGEMKIAALDGRLYVPGGMDGLGGSSARLDVFDVEAGSWERAASMPVPLNHHATVALDDRVFVLGGNESFTDPPDTFALAYDPADDEWRELTRLPDGRWGHEAVVHDGRIHILGGVPDGDADLDTLIYDPGAGSWERAAPIPTPREHVAAARLDDELVVISGRWEGELIDVVEAYAPGGDRWRALPPLPTPRSGFGAATMDGRIHAVGGEDPATVRGWTTDAHELYDPATDAWMSGTPAPLSLHGHGVAVVDDGLFVVGGAWRQGLWSLTAWNDRTFVYRP